MAAGGLNNGTGLPNGSGLTQTTGTSVGGGFSN